MLGKVNQCSLEYHPHQSALDCCQNFYCINEFSVNGREGHGNTNKNMKKTFDCAKKDEAVPKRTIIFPGNRHIKPPKFQYPVGVRSLVTRERERVG
jgi:hypothetical protein